MTAGDLKRQFPVFKGTSAEDLGVLCDTLIAHEVPAGARLVAADEASETLYLIVEGRVRVTLESGDESIVLGEFGPGHWVCEMGLIEPAPASATVSAVDECSLLSLSHTDFMALRRTCPTLTSSLVNVISNQLTERLRSTLHLIDTGEPEAVGDESGSVPRNWFIEVAQRIMGIAARSGT